MAHVDSFKRYTNKITKSLEEDQVIMGANPINPEQLTKMAEVEKLRQNEITLGLQLNDIKKKILALTIEINKANAMGAEKEAKLANQAQQAQQDVVQQQQQQPSV